MLTIHQETCLKIIPSTGKNGERTQFTYLSNLGSPVPFDPDLQRIRLGCKDIGHSVFRLTVVTQERGKSCASIAAYQDLRRHAVRVYGLSPPPVHQLFSVWDWRCDRSASCSGCLLPIPHHHYGLFLWNHSQNKSTLPYIVLDQCVLA